MHERRETGWLYDTTRLETRSRNDSWMPLGECELDNCLCHTSSSIWREQQRGEGFRCIGQRWWRAQLRDRVFEGTHAVVKVGVEEAATSRRGRSKGGNDAHVQRERHHSTL